MRTSAFSLSLSNTCSCRSRYKKNKCPFCHEVSLKDELMAVIGEFLATIKRTSRGTDANQLAAMLERWQFFEMEFSANPSVIHRVAKLVLLDSEFKGLLEKGVRERSSWMRDAAGIVFRFYALSEDDDLSLDADEKLLLRNCYGVILDVVEKMGPAGHHYGALYTQALVVFQCVAVSGQKEDRLRAVVKEVGFLIVKLYKKHKRAMPQLKREVRERIVKEYMEAASVGVWGSAEADVVKKTFYT